MRVVEQLADVFDIIVAGVAALSPLKPTAPEEELRGLVVISWSNLGDFKHQRCPVAPVHGVHDCRVLAGTGLRFPVTNPRGGVVPIIFDDVEPGWSLPVVPAEAAAPQAGRWIESVAAALERPRTAGVAPCLKATLNQFHKSKS